MSMKRSKQATGGRAARGGGSEFGFMKPPEAEKSFEEHTSGKPDEAFAAYSMKTRYAKGE